jgi:NhaA family Na+:H+ antiporter
VGGIVAANINEHSYHAILDAPLFGGFSILGHPFTLHFLINEVFMVFFFGVAAKEITESVLPGGPLNPIKKAINPLLGTIGGVVGPAGVYLLLGSILFAGHPDQGEVLKGWGIPTATDIALAWLAARVVFGTKHPAVNFLLLLAVADDGIGLGIIAIFYPDPTHPVRPEFLGVTAVGMAIAYGLRRAKVMNWAPYVAIAGAVSWVGLVLAALHPALALVFIVPFMPGPKRDAGLFAEQEDTTGMGSVGHGAHHSALHNFEHAVKVYVDFGLFFFGFANAGVAFASVGSVTWIVFASLCFGKMIGITLFSSVGQLIGFPLPSGMRIKHLFTASIVAGLGLTVALFVAGQAFPPGSQYAGPAKMGAVFSAVGGLLAFIVGRALGIRPDSSDTPSQGKSDPALTASNHTLYSSDSHAPPPM